MCHVMLTSLFIDPFGLAESLVDRIRLLITWMIPLERQTVIYCGQHDVPVSLVRGEKHPYNMINKCRSLFGIPQDGNLVMRRR